MIKLTQKAFDKLVEIANYQPTEEAPYMVVSKNNNSLQSLIEQKLIDVRDNERNKLMYDAVVLENGLKVVNNEIEHEIILGEEPMEQKQEATTQAAVAMATAALAFELTSDVPMPKGGRAARQPKPLQYPLDKMEIGQSFYIPEQDPAADLSKKRKNLVVQIFQLRKKHNIEAEFIVGIEGQGYRVWRKA